MNEVLVNYVDWFHGIGGFALGANWAGLKFKNHFCSDIDPYCQKLYKLRFPNSVQLGDITKIDTKDLKQYGTNWIFSGGFPCQDISIAGQGGGIAGSRSGLWFEYWRFIRDIRPRFAIVENVGMLVHRGLREVLGSLAEIGYNAEWQDIRAEDVGAPHRRERIWIVAYPASLGLKQGTVFGRTVQKKIGRTELDIRNKTPGEVSDTNGERYIQRQNEIDTAQKGEPAQCNVSSKSKISYTFSEHDDNTGYGTGEICRERSEKTQIQRCLSDTDCQRLEKPGPEQNRENRDKRRGVSVASDWWSAEPSVCGMANGVSDELDGYQGRLAVKSFDRVNRLRGIGNAIVPQIAQIIFEQIKEYL